MVTMVKGGSWHDHVQFYGAGAERHPGVHGWS